MRQVTFAICLCLLFGKSWVVMGQQDPEWEKLQQAIQVVRNWLGDPNAKVRFYHDWKYIDYSGPQNEFVFSVYKDEGAFTVDVDLKTMKVTGWCFHNWDDAYIGKVEGLPTLPEDQIRNIAINYVQQHFPHFNEFDNWEIEVRLWHIDILELHPEIKRASVFFNPYYINENGLKIRILPVFCGVAIDPYAGRVVGFSYRYRPIPSLDLTPKLTADEARLKVEQAVKEKGAPNVNVTSEPGFPWPDGLVIIATREGDIRLAYAFNAVYTWGAPRWGSSSDDPLVWHAAIDAHTGELLYFVPFGSMGGGEAYEESTSITRKKSIQEQSLNYQSKIFHSQSILLFLSVALLGFVGILIFILRWIFKLSMH